MSKQKNIILVKLASSFFQKPDAHEKAAVRKLLLTGLIGFAAIGCGGKPTSSTPATPPPVGPSKPPTPSDTKPATSPANPDSPPKRLTEADLATAKPDFTMTAFEWYQAISDQKWKEKYVGKVIELSGTVRYLANSTGSNANFGLYGADDGGRSIVTASTEQKQLWEKTGKGSKVVIRGTPTKIGDIVDASLNPAILVSTEPNPAKTYQSTDLAKEAAGDIEAARKKHNSEFIFLVGELVTYRPSVPEDGTGNLILKGSGDVEVRIRCMQVSSRIAKTLKPGTTIKAYGDVNFFPAKNNNKAYVGLGEEMFKAE